MEWNRCLHGMRVGEVRSRRGREGGKGNVNRQSEKQTWGMTVCLACECVCAGGASNGVREIFSQISPCLEKTELLLGKTRSSSLVLLEFNGPSLHPHESDVVGGMAQPTPPWEAFQPLLCHPTSLLLQNASPSTRNSLDSLPQSSPKF